MTERFRGSLSVLNYRMTLEGSGMRFGPDIPNIPTINNTTLLSKFSPQVAPFASTALDSLVDYLSGPLIIDSHTNHLERRKQIAELTYKQGADFGLYVDTNRLSGGQLGLVNRAVANLGLYAQHSGNTIIEKSMQQVLIRLNGSFPIELKVDKYSKGINKKIYDPLPLVVKLGIVANYDTITGSVLENILS